MRSINVLDQLQARIGSADWSKWGVYRWDYWDYVRYPSAGTTSPLNFFVNPAGTVDPNSSLSKTIEQANFPKSRSFGQVFFILQEIKTHVHILPKNRQPAGISGDADCLFTTMQDMMEQFYDLLGSGVLNIKIGQKDYFQINKPFEHCPPGFGPSIRQHATVAANNGVWIQQSSNGKDTWVVSPAQMIEPEQTIDVSIEFPEGNPAVFTNLVNSASPAIDIGVILSGYLARPAQ